MSDFLYRLKRKIKKETGLWLFQKVRILKYKLLSDIYKLYGKPHIAQPVLMCGEGEIHTGKDVVMGILSSPNFYTGYSYIEARNKNSSVKIGNNVLINNNATILSEGEGIFIGDNTLIGINSVIIDSDFHRDVIDPQKRLMEQTATRKVIIEENVLIGANVTILKGVTIGKNSIIGANSTVTKSVPENSVVAGNPAKVIKQL